MTNYLAGVQNIESNAVKAVTVTTHNTNSIEPTKGIYVGTAGDLSLTVGGVDITFTNLASGVIHPITATRVRTTGTTATNIIVVY